MAKVTIRWSETTPQQRKKMIRDLGKQLDVNESIESLIATICGFEEKYGMSTVEFYARFMAGKMGDSADVMKWAMAYDTYNHLINEHFQRKAVG